MDYKLTKEAVEQIRRVAQEIIQQDKEGTLSPFMRGRKKDMEKVQKMNKEVGFSLMDTCFCGPANMSRLLTNTALQHEHVMGDDAWQVYYALAIEEVLGTSTRMEYDKEKNMFWAYTPREGDANTKGERAFDPDIDMELGFWDKLCAFFGITTDHAKKVAFAKESIKEQNDQLDGFNKAVVLSKKNEFMKKHKDFADHYKKVVEEAEKTEKAFQKLFFKNETFPDYTFKTGQKMSALTACIAMYHKDPIKGKDIAKMTLEEINLPENQDLRDKLRTIGEEYKKLTGKEAQVRTQQFQYVDQFLFEKNEKYSLMDKALLAKMETKTPFIIGFEKLKEQEDIKNISVEAHRNEMIGARASVMYKAKTELVKVFEEALGKEGKTGYPLGNDKTRADNRLYFGAFKAAKENHLFMINMKNSNYGNTRAYLEKLNADMNELLGIDGLRTGDYNNLLADADKLIEQKELLSGIKTLKTKETEKKDNIISVDAVENDMEFGGKF